MPDKTIATRYAILEMSVVDEPASLAVKVAEPAGTPFNKAVATDPGQPKKRNIMREFRLTEISAVDAPAQQGALAMIMKRDVSVDDPAEPEGFESFEAALADGLLKRANGESRQSVMERVRKNYPQLFAASQERPVEPPKSFEKSEVSKAAIAKFEGKVDELRRAGGLTRNTALEMARKLHPKLYRDYQNA